MSRRRQLLDSIAAKIAAATGISRVEPWRSSSFTPGNLPAIAWRDRSSRSADYAIGGRYQLLTVLYAAYSFGSAAASRETLRQMLAAVGSDTSQGGLAISTDYLASRIGINVAGDLVVGCELRIEILYQVIGEDLHTDRLQDENENNLTDENGDTLTW